MTGYDLPRLHAAMNDLPAALLLIAVLFDLAGWALKRESLVWAGIWTLWAGVVGGWAAVIAGELAERKIEHGEALHEIMKRHETMAIATMITFTVVLAWKLWRRFQLGVGEDRVLKLMSVVGMVLLVRTGYLGGELVFEHAAGIPTAAMRAEIENREEGHHHEGGTVDSAVSHDSAPPPHQDPPGSPPHPH